jgi:hypothetical protein
MFVQWAIACPPLMRRIEAVVQSHIQAHVPMEYHVTSMLDGDRRPEKKLPNAFRACQNSPLVPYCGTSIKPLVHYNRKDRSAWIHDPTCDRPSKAFQDLLFPFMCYTQVRNAQQRGWC